MKERPILFSGAMVRALLDGSKTQTRRVVKPYQLAIYDATENDAAHAWSAVAQRDPRWGFCVFGRTEAECMRRVGEDGLCPYGGPGERLWVRETFYAYGRWEFRYSGKKGRDEWHFVDMTLECDRVYQYAADNPGLPLATGRGATPGWYKRPAIHMPRCACRILLDNKAVRVERLQDISEADAIAEGCKNTLHLPGGRFANENFAHLWWTINGDGSWEADPWVWVIGFKRVQP